MAKMKKDVMAMMAKRLSPEARARAEKETARILAMIKLSEAREASNITQSQMDGFSQPGISAIESGKDIKLSTLMNYSEALGAGLEINIYPRESDPINILNMSKG